MTFNSTVTVNGEEQEALKCGFKCERSVDQKGAPSSSIANLRLWFEVVSTDSTAYLESAFAEQKPLKGKLSFQKGNEQSIMKDVEFEEGYIVRFREEYDRQGEATMTTFVEMTARKVACGNAAYEANWV